MLVDFFSIFLSPHDWRPCSRWVDFTDGQEIRAADRWEVLSPPIRIRLTEVDEVVTTDRLTTLRGIHALYRSSSGLLRSSRISNYTTVEVLTLYNYGLSTLLTPRSAYRATFTMIPATPPDQMPAMRAEVLRKNPPLANLVWAISKRLYKDLVEGRDIKEGRYVP